jgi:hypothetical protein
MLWKFVILATALAFSPSTFAQDTTNPPPLSSATGARPVSMTRNGNGTITVRYADGFQFTAVMSESEIRLFTRLTNIGPAGTPT